MGLKKFIKENNLKQPKTFEDVLKLQAILDNHMHNVRERTSLKIKLSLVASIVKFNEETDDSHKTWEIKEQDKEKILEKLTDIYFFFAQFINADKYIKDSCNNYFDYFIYTGRACSALGLIYFLSESAYVEFSLSLIKLTKFYGYKKQDILKSYWNKWQNSMKIIIEKGD